MVVAKLGFSFQETVFMKNSGALFAAVWTWLVLGTARAQEIVVNSSVKIDEISKADLHSIFTGTSSNYKDGSRAVPVQMKSGPIHEAFLKTYMGKNDVAFRAVWNVLVFSGQATMPKSFDTEAGLLDYIAKIPGAIGYVGSSTDPGKAKALVVK